MGVLPEDQWRIGFIGEAGNSKGSMMLRVFNNPVGRAWWRSVREGSHDSEIGEAMDTLLADGRNHPGQDFEQIYRKALAEEHAATR
jgi:hypothetical protein